MAFSDFVATFISFIYFHVYDIKRVALQYLTDWIVSFLYSYFFFVSIALLFFALSFILWPIDCVCVCVCLYAPLDCVC